VLNRRYNHNTRKVLLSFLDKIERTEDEQKIPTRRLIWMCIELVVCAVHEGDFYTVIDNEPEFRDVVLISGDHPSNGYCVRVVNTTK
jgi:hypothetical protein